MPPACFPACISMPPNQHCCTTRPAHYASALLVSRVGALPVYRSQSSELFANAGCERCEGVRVEEEVHNCGPMFCGVHALQHGPRKHEHSHPAHEQTVWLGQCHHRSCPVLLFLVSPAFHSFDCIPAFLSAGHAYTSSLHIVRMQSYQAFLAFIKRLGNFVGHCKSRMTVYILRSPVIGSPCANTLHAPPVLWWHEVHLKGPTLVSATSAIHNECLAGFCTGVTSPHRWPAECGQTSMAARRCWDLGSSGGA